MSSNLVYIGNYWLLWMPHFFTEGSVNEVDSNFAFINGVHRVDNDDNAKDDDE